MTGHAAAALQTLTDFADQAVILPVFAAVLLALLWLGWRHGAVAWLGIAGGSLVLMLGAKLVFAACGPPPGAGVLANPSGHTAAAAAIYGGAIGLLLRGRAARARLAPVALAGLLLALGIGITRLWLGYHSLPDVLAGGAVGVAAAVLLVRLAGAPPPRPSRRLLLAPLLALPALLHGLHLQAEPRIHAAAGIWPLSLCRAH